MDRPGAFVLASNDYYAPRPEEPAQVLLARPQAGARRPSCPWRDLRDGMLARGWLDLTNAAGELTVGGRRIVFAGVDDSHLKRDRYDEVAGPADRGRRRAASAWPTPPSRGCSTGSPPTATTCCCAGTPTAASCGCRSTARWSPTAASTGTGSAGCTAGPSPRPDRPAGTWLHVSAGLGTSPYAPVRFACPPEATLLTLTARGPPEPTAWPAAGPRTRER